MTWECKHWKKEDERRTFGNFHTFSYFSHCSHFPPPQEALPTHISLELNF